MRVCGSLNVRLSNSKLNKLESGKKKVLNYFNLLSNVIGGFNDETNFLEKLLLNEIQVSRLCQPFPNNSLASY